MKKILIVVLLLLAFYLLYFRAKEVTYQGENENWEVEIFAKLIGMESQQSVKIKYKGKQPIYQAEYGLHPHYGGAMILSNDVPNMDLKGSPSPNKGFDQNGVYYAKCKDCGYYDKSEELLFAIHWRTGEFSEEKTELFSLKRNK